MKKSINIYTVQSNETASLTVSSANTGKTFTFLLDVTTLERVKALHWSFVESYPGLVYARCTFPCKGQPHIPLHHFVLGCPEIPEDFEVDHIDRNTLNNKEENLRLVHKNVNKRNRSKRAASSSKFIGVRSYSNPVEGRRNWRAFIAVNGKQVHLGAFHLEEDAAKARDKAAKCYFGGFAKLNFPET